jgi:pimeloyl-ACP methyl ester carboxylesterase
VTERVISTNGVDLHVVEEGAGFPVVFAHGFPEPTALPAWLDQAELDHYGAGHWVQQEAPDPVDAAVIEFLRGLPV